ncbi:UNVERIFIED_CONTAM: hypothetical protein Slati_0401800 [Sesamum latifolium]|uniref:RNase H type-1 domain-containing protein n=1 Tax=Sesamum latifolium TaxID=2727402 RepID=A0AAW2XVD5_9LAMI
MRHRLSAGIRKIQKVLGRAPLLVKPSPGDTLYLYISTTPQAVSSVPIREDGGKQIPIYCTLGKPDTSGRSLKCTVKLREYDIFYLPQITIKAQALTDFVSEMTGTPLDKKSKKEVWLLHVDGSTTMQGGRAVKQVQGTYEVKEEIMMQYLQQIAELKARFESFQLIQIPSEENVKADCLSKLESTLDDCRTRHITIQHLPEPWAPLGIQAISPAEDWQTVGEILHNKSFTHTLLRCLSQQEGIHVLKEIHGDCCGAHAGTWILANKTL